MKNRILWLTSFFVVTLALVSVAAGAPEDKKQGATGATAGQCAGSVLFPVSKPENDQGTKPAAFQGGGRQGGGRGGQTAFVQDKGKGKGDGFPGGKGKGKGDGFGGKGKGPKGALPADATVDRILSFDKNNDGKITKDELPERLQDLIAKGDTNKDDALDRSEIQSLVANQQVTFGGFGGFGGPKGGKGGKGPKGPPGGILGPFAGPKAIERTLDELNLSGSSKDKAEAALKAHQENVRKLMDLARSDLLIKMKDVLSEQEYRTFREVLERQPGPPAFVGGSTATADLERRLEQLQKQLEDLRRDLRR